MEHGQRLGDIDRGLLKQVEIVGFIIFTGGRAGRKCPEIGPAYGKSPADRVHLPQPPQIQILRQPVIKSPGQKFPLRIAFRTPGQPVRRQPALQSVPVDHLRETVEIRHGLRQRRENGPVEFGDLRRCQDDPLRRRHALDPEIRLQHRRRHPRQSGRFRCRRQTGR